MKILREMTESRLGTLTLGLLKMILIWSESTGVLSEITEDADGDMHQVDWKREVVV